MEVSHRNKEPSGETDFERHLRAVFRAGGGPGDGDPTCLQIIC